MRLSDGHHVLWCVRQRQAHLAHRAQRCLTLERLQWLSYVSRGSDLPRQMVGGFCNLNGQRCVVRRQLQIHTTVWFWGFQHPSIDDSDQRALHPSSLESGG